MIIASLGYDGPGDASALVGSAQWLQALLLGSIASVIAVIAIAVVGLMMLNGRIDIRRGITVVVGCFLLFGAPAIAAGLLGAAAGNVTQPTPYAEPSVTIGPPAAMSTPTRTPTPYDPYAGASVPSRN